MNRKIFSLFLIITISLGIACIVISGNKVKGVSEDITDPLNNTGLDYNVGWPQWLQNTAGELDVRYEQSELVVKPSVSRKVYGTWNIVDENQLIEFREIKTCMELPDLTTNIYIGCNGKKFLWTGLNVVDGEIRVSLEDLEPYTVKNSTYFDGVNRIFDFYFYHEARNKAGELISRKVWCKQTINIPENDFIEFNKKKLEALEKEKEMNDEETIKKRYEGKKYEKFNGFVEVVKDGIMLKKKDIQEPQYVGKKFNIGTGDTVIGNNDNVCGKVKIEYKLWDSNFKKYEFYLKGISELNFEDKSVVTVNQGLVNIKSFSDENEDAESNLIIQTPTAFLTLSSGEMLLDVKNDGNTYAYLFSGRLSVSGKKGGTILLKPGMKTFVKGEPLSEIQFMLRDEKGELKKIVPDYTLLIIITGFSGVIILISLVLIINKVSKKNKERIIRERIAAASMAGNLCETLQPIASNNGEKGFSISDIEEM